MPPQRTARPAGRTFCDVGKARLLRDRGVVIGLYRDRHLRHADGKLWIERATVGRRFSGEHVGSAEAERIIRLVAAHAGGRGQRVRLA